MRTVAVDQRNNTAVIAAGLRGPAGKDGGDKEVTTLPAAEVLSGHRGVMYDGAGVMLASPDAPELCIGVTEHAAVVGEPVRVRRSGTMQELTWNWTPGTVYLAAGGVLTQDVPIDGALLQIGVALSPTMLDVRIGTPIFFE